MEIAVQTEFVDALSAIRTLAELTPSLRPEAIEEALRKLKADSGFIITLGKQIRDKCRAFLRLPDERQTEPDLTHALVLSGYAAENLEKVAALGRRAPLASKRLSSEISEFADLAEEFRDLEETFALSLSPAFREEVKKAREQALRS